MGLSKEDKEQLEQRCAIFRRDLIKLLYGIQT